MPTHQQLSMTLEQKFWLKIRKTESCWEWTGYIDTGGYGRFCINRKGVAAHRAIFQFLGHEIPRGLQVDHICRNRKCLNPDHLRFVTHKVNSTENSLGACARNKRKTHCKRGHLLERENLLPWALKKGHRKCALCMRMHYKKFYYGDSPKSKAERSRRKPRFVQVSQND